MFAGNCDQWQHHDPVMRECVFRLGPCPFVVALQNLWWGPRKDHRQQGSPCSVHFFVLNLSHTHGCTQPLHFLFSLSPSFCFSPFLFLWWLGCGQEDSLSLSVLSSALSQKVWTSKKKPIIFGFCLFVVGAPYKTLLSSLFSFFLLFSFLFSLRACFIMCPCHIKHSGLWLLLSLQHTMT